MRNLRFAISEQERRRITREEYIKIRKMYQGLADNLRKEAKNYPKNSFERKYRTNMVKLLNQGIADIGRDIEHDIRENAIEMSQSVIQENSDIWRKYGLKLAGNVASLSTDIVETIISGQLYQSNWSLSESIWISNKKIQEGVQNIIGMGVAGNLPAYDIARHLGDYIDPTAAKSSKKIVYQDRITKKKKVFYFGNVDYNAQRLARTMVSHAYQEAFVRVTRKNPFITKYRWDASNSRPCPICLDRDGKLFEKDNLPLDHPNGMCTFEAVIDLDDQQINQTIAGWYHSPPGTYPGLDAYMVDIQERHG